MAAFASLASQQGKKLTFKKVAHMKDYDKSLAKAAGKVQGATMAASYQLDQDQQSPAQELSDADLVAALKGILRECLEQLQQPTGGGITLPPILLELLTGGVGLSASGSPQGDTPPSRASGSGITPAVAVAAAAGVVAVTAAAGHTREQSPAQAVTNAFSLLQAPRGGVYISKKTRKATQPGGGKGIGGEGGSKVCVPCTVVKYQLKKAEEARCHADPVIMSKSHQPGGARECPYCKCQDCRKAWSHKRAITSYDFPRKANCRGA